MNKPIAVFFGPLGGNTEKIAKLVQNKIGKQECKLIPVKDATIDDLNQYSNIIFGVSTIGTHTWSHENATDWDSFLPKLRNADLKGKTVAIFGLGDQIAYANHFVDDMHLVYNAVIDNGAHPIGYWPTEGYDFNESEAVIEDNFVGLAIDEDHQSELTKNRINNWIELIVPLFK